MFTVIHHNNDNYMVMILISITVYDFDNIYNHTSQFVKTVMFAIINDDGYFNEVRLLAIDLILLLKLFL